MARGGNGPLGKLGAGVILREPSAPYSVISPETALGGAVYPFLAQTGRAWRIVARPVDGQEEVAPADTFGQETPTLRWVNGDQVTDLYVDGMDTNQFLQATGLTLSLKKGSFVLSKRLSRLMRPHFVSGFFAPDEVRWLTWTRPRKRPRCGTGRA